MFGIRRLAVALLGDYYVFRIFCRELDSSVTRPKTGFVILDQPYDGEPRGYAGPDAYSFGYEENGDILSRCWIWYGARYNENRGFWPLKDREAKLIALNTTEAARGRGLAPKLLDYTCGELKARGFDRLYARIWHSNAPSIRAFEKAGWRYHAMVIEFDLLGKRRRLVLRK